MIEHAEDRSSPEFWLFGYGSLIWNPGFRFMERQTCRVRNWSRRFWQGSSDHRGTPQHPGRVVTLVRDPGHWCVGRAYRLCGSVAQEVLEALDLREQDGYEQTYLPVEFSDGRTRECLTYVAFPGNPRFLGPRPLDELVGQILRCAGPSGPNREYVFKLEQCLAELGHPDPHVSELANALRRSLGNPR